MDVVTLLEEYARRFNAGNATGDLTGVADLRTEDAILVWRAPDMPEIRGRMESAGDAIPVGATIAFDDLQASDGGRAATARITGRGFPRGEIQGRATFEFEEERICSFTVELDHPLKA